MTTRGDIPRLAASLAVLGTALEGNGQTAWDRMAGWELGPLKAPTVGERGGGIREGAEAEDRKDEHAQARNASRRFRVYRERLAELDRLVQDVLRDVDIAVPPNPADLKNRATGDFDPITPAEAAVSGWCASCWRNDQQMVVREVEKRSGLCYSSTLCRWCLGVKSAYGMEPTVDLLRLRHAGRRISTQVMDEAMRAAVAAAAPKAKGRKKNRRKANA